MLNGVDSLIYLSDFSWLVYRNASDFCVFCVSATLLSSLIVVARTSKTMLNNSIEQCWTLHPNAKEYTFFSSAHGTFSKIDHFSCHKSNLSKFKKIEIVKHLLRPQWYETRYQLQEKKLLKKKKKGRWEIKQHVSN